MKKTKTMRIAVLMLALTLLTCCFVGSTFAKYTSSAEGSSAARVALWDITYNAEDITVDGSSETVTFDLFESVNDVNVKTGTDENIIAPGTSGSFTYTINNKSEVTAKYAIDYTITNTNNIPVQFKVNDGEWKNTLDDIDFTNIEMTSGSDEYVIYWQWVFETDADTDADGMQADAALDNADTLLGTVGTAQITVEMSITVEQVD